MPTFRWTFAADDKGVAKMMRDTAAAVKQAEAATGSAGAKMSADLDKVTAAAERTAKSGKTLSEGFAGGLTKSLSQEFQSLAPASVSNISSQFGGVGAAFGGITAGAAAATAGIAVAGAAAVKFGVDSIKSFESSALAVRHFQEIAGGSAEQASVLVGASKALGVSSADLALGFSRLEKNIGTNEQKFAAWGITVKKNADGTTDMIGTFENAAAALTAIQDPEQRGIEGNALFGRSWANMADIITQSGSVLDSALASAAAHAPIFNQKDLADAQKLREETVALSQEWDKLKVKTAEKLIPFLEREIEGLQNLGREVGNVHSQYDSFTASLTQKKPDDNWLTQGLKNVNELLSATLGGGPGAGKSVSDLGDAASGAANKISNAAFSAGIAHNEFTKLSDPVPPDAIRRLGDESLITAGKLTSAATSAGEVVSAIQGLASGTSVQTTGTAGWGNAIDAANASLNQGSADAAAYADAQTQGARQIASAEKSVTDAIASVADAQDSLAKASVAAARSIADAENGYLKAVDDAARKVADVEDASSKRIVDAQQKVTDARHQAAEAAVGSARRVEDATQALRDAEINALRETNPYDAQRKREDAILQLTRAQEDAAKQQSDSADTVSRAQQGLADTQVQASTDRADAERQAADSIATAQQRVVDAHNQAADQIEAAQKRVLDAGAKVSEANGRLQQTTDDVAASLEKAATKADGHAVSLQGAQTQAQAVVDASPAFVLAMQARGVSLEDINTALAGGKTAIENLGTAFGIPKPVIDDMIAQLDQVLIRVLAIRDMTKNSYDWWAALVRSVPAGVTAEQAVADAGWSGGQLKPTHDSGGWLPMGVSLAVNKTGRPERVLSPAEMDGMGGGGGNVINIGHVLDARGLAALLVDLERRGYVTSRKRD